MAPLLNNAKSSELEPQVNNMSKQSKPGNAFATDGSGPAALSAMSDLNVWKLFDPNSPWVVSCVRILAVPSMNIMPLPKPAYLLSLACTRRISDGILRLCT